MSGGITKLTDKELEELVKYALEEDASEISGKPIRTRPRRVWTKLSLVIQRVRKTAGREKRETIVAAKILRRYVVHQDITEEEKQFLKEQSIDLARIIPIVLVQAVPAPIPITPFLIMFGKKVGIDLVPKEQKIPQMHERKDEPDKRFKKE